MRYFALIREFDFKSEKEKCRERRRAFTDGRGRPALSTLSSSFGVLTLWFLLLDRMPLIVVFFLFIYKNNVRGLK